MIREIETLHKRINISTDAKTVSFEVWGLTWEELSTKLGLICQHGFWYKDKEMWFPPNRITNIGVEDIKE